MQSRVSDIKASMRRLEAELARLERFPDDDFVDGTIIRFDVELAVRRRNGDSTGEKCFFTYAALKVAATGTWWVTGRYAHGEPTDSRRGLTYDELRQVMAEARNVRVFIGDGEPLERAVAGELGGDDGGNVNEDVGG